MFTFRLSDCGDDRFYFDVMFELSLQATRRS